MTEANQETSEETAKDQPNPELVRHFLERIQNTPPQKLAEELALERIKLEAEKAEAEETSRVDALTKLGNLRAYEEGIEKAIEAAISTGRPFSIIFTDIDHFSKVNNDHAGRHQAGNAVLKTVAETLVKSTKVGLDKTFRYGGEEMVTISPVDLKTAIGIAERQRRNMEQVTTHFSEEGVEEAISVTISSGVSCFNPKEVPLLASLDPNDHAKNSQIVDEVVQETKKRIMIEADTAMYAAKEAGRNMVAFKEKGSNTVGVIKRDPQDPGKTLVEHIPFHSRPR